MVNNDWDLLCVYGPPQHHLRNIFWVNLSDYAAQIPKPLCIVGDLNAISNLTEKQGGSQKSNPANCEFKNFIHSRSLIGMGFIGPAFMWSNGATMDEPIFERLDIAICTPDWLFMFQNNRVMHLPRLKSDHAPILINTYRVNNMKTKFSINFEYYWVDHPEFNNLVHNSWDSNNLSIVDKINDVGRELNKWSRKEIGNIFRVFEETKQQLLGVQMDSHTRDTKQEEKELCQRIDYLNLLHQRYYEQGSKVNWIPNVDKNTHVFHLYVIQRKRRNQIVTIKSSEGNWITETSEVINFLVNHFTNLFKRDPDEDILRKI